MNAKQCCEVCAKASKVPTATVELPEQVSDGFARARWEVDVWDAHFDMLRTGTRGGEVSVRRSDGRITVLGIPSCLDDTATARRLAAALLAAADWVDAHGVGEPA